MCPFMKNVKVSDGGYFIDFMINCRIQLKCEDMELFCMILWRVWFRPNSLIFKSVILHDTDIVPWTIACLDDFRRANDKVMGDDRRYQKASILWQPPSVGFYKGQVMGCCAQKILARYSPQVAEALAVLRGIQFAREVGL
ncbi:hypothetical protein Dsin_025814 [Dipteronia sinensis]|uniref:RNase H type-1 domain-containing protein n=1 Tax=Dipteronia sinensis TaxID=43782 RepID=A0AAD9ZXN7_9ROSI|nr:hypothetical protein Dsin_025814 [Dipteronia sinensis]